VTAIAAALDEILDAKRREVAERRRRAPEAALAERARAAAPARGFRARLAAAADEGADARHVALIAEVKRRSPSAGALAAGADLAAIARAYEAGGACALSVLTDEAYFGGRDEDLAACRAAARLPALRKDFVVDPYQIVEARALGADAVLLIVRALSDALLAETAAAARAWGLDALVEVHDERDLERALALGDPLIGINNRDLATLTTNLGVTERLAPHVPRGVPVVCESGIETADDVRRIAACGVRAFLVGAALLRAPDQAAKVRELVEALR
jgi:indole-3-glycerol phosphate synthase